MLLFFFVLVFFGALLVSIFFPCMVKPFLFNQKVTIQKEKKKNHSTRRLGNYMRERGFSYSHQMWFLLFVLHRMMKWTIKCITDMFAKIVRQ